MENQVMTNKKQVILLNYLLPMVMISLGVLHFLKHGLDLATIIPVILGSSALYMAIFNHLLLQRVIDFITKVWYPISQAITVVLLTITFYAVFAPVGLFFRLFRRDVLNKDFRVIHFSYWLDRSKKTQSNYTQQF